LTASSAEHSQLSGVLQQGTESTFHKFQKSSNGANMTVDTPLIGCVSVQTV